MYRKCIGSDPTAARLDFALYEVAGGKGRIVGTLIGALILGFLNNGLNLLGVSSYYQMIVKAVVILLAVLVDNKKQ